MVKLPNFLIVGATKSGTTSLYHYLKQHPDIFFPEVKEPLFFLSDYYRKLNPVDPKYDAINAQIIHKEDEYRNLFLNADSYRAVGDASVLYLYFHQISIKRIKEYLGEDVKIIIILRNPVERAFSAYKALVRDGDEKLTFEEALKEEKYRIKENFNPMYYYIDQGFYYKQVKAFKQDFNQVKVVRYDDLVVNAKGLISDLIGFLGLRQDKMPNFSPTNHNRTIIHRLHKTDKLLSYLKIGKYVRNGRTRKFLNYIKNIYQELNTKQIKMNDQVKIKLFNTYKGDMNNLSKLLDTDFYSWMEETNTNSK